MADTEIREGFLCPICLADLGTVIQLQKHFEESHSSEDSDVLQTFKELIGKAKRRIKQDILSDLKRNSSEDEDAVTEGSAWLAQAWMPQEMGAAQSHSDYFRKVRSERMDHFAAETNKLIIRLDKLIADLPADPVKRKAHEKKLVLWVDDANINLCPDCARSFGLTRRRHHCRLCGFITCHDCSRFISLTDAKKLIGPSLMPVSGISPSLSPSPIRPAKQGASLPTLRRSGSSSSLNSMQSLVDAMTGEVQLRVCSHCRKLLIRREEQQEQRTSQSILQQFYDRLMSLMLEAQKLSPMYCKMIESLSCGDTLYNLQDAKELRVKLLKLAENIDVLSKKISVLGTDNPEKPLGDTAANLQKRVRYAAVSYLKNELICLPGLPSEDQLLLLQQKRRDEIQRKLDAQKDSPSSSKTTATSHLPMTLRRNNGGDQIQYEDGWVADVSKKSSNIDDPLVQQINIISSYIKQARDAHKYDEVAMLESNLKELKAEYWRQQHPGDNR